MAESLAEHLWADVARILIELSEEDCQRLGIREQGLTSFGSGRLIGRNLVVTARHVLESTSGIKLPDEGWEVRLLGDRIDGRWDGPPIAARVVWRGHGSHDLALLELQQVDRQPDNRLKIRFGKYHSPMDLDGVWIAGFPQAARIERNVAKEYSAPARLRKADTGPLYRLTIATANAPKEGEDWSGCSGSSVVLCQGERLWLLGVVQHVPTAFGAGSLEVASVESALSDAAFESIIKRCCPSDHVDDLQKLPGPYAVVGAEAYAASRRTLDSTANKAFFGRDKDLETLDKIFEHSCGVTLLRAEAGLGKSTLAARWADRCAANAGTVVLSHAFSVREPRAGTRSSMVENLVRQAAVSLGSEVLGEGEPGHPTRLADRLATLLGGDQPEGTRLVVILDALDEAAEPIDPWATKIGRGVYILVTCRAEADETPAVLRTWHKRCKEDGTLAPEIALSPLDAAAIAAWLSAAVEQDFAATDPLVTRARTASEGIPLFAAFLIPDAIQEMRAGTKDPFPPSFASYARQRLEELRALYARPHGGAWSWTKVLNLFALLTVAKAPLPPMWIHRLFGDGKFGGPTLDELDQRVDRWLWRRAQGVSFAHPRLASVFASVLPEFDVDVRAIEALLLEECTTAIASTKGTVLTPYALAWLPMHWLGRDEPKEAAKLLGSGAFIVARLRQRPTDAGATVRKTAGETFDVDRTIGGSDVSLAAWRRFWSETEGRVLGGLAYAEWMALEPLGIFAQLVRDRFGDMSPIYLATASAISDAEIAAPRLTGVCAFRHPFLLRSINAHAGGVLGVLALDDGLVSWGRDGAIRFWDRAGQPRPGGDAQAHAGGVLGVLALDDGLVSWGRDGAIRFWDRAGQPRPGGDAQAHAGGVLGVLALDDGLVSWGDDGAIRFWDRAGQPRPGGDAQAHAGWFLGVLALDDGLVSWGDDGAIRFWDRAGQPRPGGDAQAHAGGVWGVLALDDGLVSWGRDGAIRFWDRAGQPRPGGDAQAHAGGVLGVLALDDGLVSWGRDGAIRFWDRAGQPRPGGDAQAHAGGVWGVLALDDGLVSWGRDGAIRFWDRAGQPRPGGDAQAHAGGVWGVLALDDGLVSWGRDGAIRFWDRAGQPRPGGDAQAHAGGVWGVLALDDGLVSWGDDGAIRFWDRAGQPRPGGDAQAHAGGVLGVLALDDGLVSWGRDGAIRFWDRAGQPRPGGDAQAHAGGVWGVLALDDGLVSWGRDGAIRFWDRAGQPRPGGDAQAHAGGVLGVLALDDGLVSWGDDGAIRFWDRAGQPRPGGDAQAHAGGVWGVLALDDGLVSWGDDGAIRFWDRAGQPRPGGDAQAHAGGVLGVLALDDGLVSWGRDGAIRFWDRAGQPRPGGDAQAHAGWFLGVLALDDGLVSWGDDGAIRFWDRAGQPRPGGDAQAHAGGVLGVLALDDGLVSWGRDGAIRFWDRAGQPASCCPWFAPASLEFVQAISDEVWVGLVGRPFQLLREKMRPAARYPCETKSS